MYSAVRIAVSVYPAHTRGRSEEADTASDVAQVSDIAGTVTLICCLPGVSVNKLKRREKRDTSEKQERIGLTVELTARAKPSQVNSLLEIRHDSVMNEHTPRRY